MSKKTITADTNSPLPNPLPLAGDGANESGGGIDLEPHGHGGSYVLDPDGDTRSLIERTQPADHQPEKG